MLIVPVPWSSRPWALSFLTLNALSETTNKANDKRHKTSIDWIMQPVRTSAWYVKQEPTCSDALAVVRRHIWFGLWGKYIKSAAEPDYVLIPASVFNGLLDSICYST